MKTNLLIKEPPLQVLPTLANKIGLNEAIVLQQIHYWLNNPKSGEIRDGYKWIYNTYEEWQASNFPFWSTSTIKRIFLSLEEKELLISEQLDRRRRDMRKYYRIGYEALAQLDELKLSSSHELKLSSSMSSSCYDVNKESETTPETTTRELPSLQDPSNAPPVEAAPFPGEEPSIVQNPGAYAALVRYAHGNGRRVDLAWLEESLWPLARAFVETANIAPHKSEYTRWRKDLRMFWESGITPDQLVGAIHKMRADGLTIKTPGSVYGVARDLPAQQASEIQEVIWERH